jgi:hypothetical protein
MCSAPGHAAASFSECVEQGKTRVSLPQNSLCFFLGVISIAENVLVEFQMYIVYMGERKHDDPSVVTSSHHDMLTSILGR